MAACAADVPAQRVEAHTQPPVYDSASAAAAAVVAAAVRRDKVLVACIATKGTGPLTRADVASAERSLMFVDRAVCTALAALRAAQKEMPRPQFYEALETLLQVFSNILQDPTNEKFRTLRKTNSIVRQKFAHHAFIEALKVCGFCDLGEDYVCYSSEEDLALMSDMATVLKAAAPLSPEDPVRPLDDVVVRDPPPPPASVSVVEQAARPAIAATPVPAGPTPTRLMTERDLGRKLEKQRQAQQVSLQELRRERQEKFQQEGSGRPVGGLSLSTTRDVVLDASPTRMNESCVDRTKCCVQ